MTSSVVSVALDSPSPVSVVVFLEYSRIISILMPRDTSAILLRRSAYFSRSSSSNMLNFSTLNVPKFLPAKPAFTAVTFVI